MRWEEKRRVKVSWPVRERRRTRRRPSPTGARIDLDSRHKTLVNQKGNI